MRRDMLCHWMSTAKPVAAIAIGQLLDRQLLSLASPVATHIPEFGCHGKEAVLVEHLLTHTSGFPFADSECWRDSMGDWSRVLDAICRARLEKDWVPGERAGYHPSSSWFVLGELVRRCDGRPFEQYVRECPQCAMSKKHGHTSRLSFWDNFPIPSRPGEMLAIDVVEA